MPRRLAFLLTALAIHAAAGPTHAATIQVNPDGSGDAPTIAAALGMSVAGDVIQLGDGVFHEHDLALKAGVSLMGNADPSLVTVDADGAGRCFSAINYHQTVQGITFRNGVHAYEGGIAVFTGTSALFRNCVFRGGSTAFRGGAISITSGSPRFDHCRFESNSASVGGAIFSDTVTHADYCEFHGNTAQVNGGAIFAAKDLFDGRGVASWRCVFGNNTANGDGGAVYSLGFHYNDGSSLIECTFFGNAATNGGAARLSLLDCLSDSRFIANEASGRGGAVLFVDAVSLYAEQCRSIRDCLFSGNRAGSQGGACAFTNSDVQLVGCTWVLNEAPQGGHATVDDDSVARWGHAILAFATAGGAVSGHGRGSIGCSDVFGNVGGDFTGPLTGEEVGNFSEDPRFCDIMADDYTLQAGSPCLVGTCGQVGAYGSGCGPVSVRDRSWGRVKSDFR